MEKNILQMNLHKLTLNDKNQNEVQHSENIHYISGI